MMNKETSRPTSSRPKKPQQATSALFVPWQTVAEQLEIPGEQQVLSEDLRTMFQTTIGILPTEERRFHELQGWPSTELDPAEKDTGCPNSFGLHVRDTSLGPVFLRIHTLAHGAILAS